MRFLFYLLLLDQVYATFEELIERLTLQHAILQQSEVDELMNDRVTLGILGNHTLFLVFLLLDSLLSLSLLVFILLCQLVIFLLVLLPTDDGKTCLLSL